jgi:hypothetical protein
MSREIPGPGWEFRDYRTRFRLLRWKLKGRWSRPKIQGVVGRSR